MGNSIYVILAILALQAISSYLAHRKKEQIRKAKMAEAKERGMQHAGQGAENLGDHGEPHADTMQDGDSLEARRRAQLEQLRQRREGRRTGVNVHQVPSIDGQQGSVRQGVPRRQAPVVVAPTIGTSDQARIIAQQAAAREREAARQRKDEQSRIATMRQEAEDAMSRQLAQSRQGTAADESNVLQRNDMTQTAAALGRLNTRSRVDAAAAGVGSYFDNPKSLRDVIVLREILDSPLGLRKPSSQD